MTHSEQLVTDRGVPPRKPISSETRDGDRLEIAGGTRGDGRALIEHECVEDIAYRVIAANEVPDHTTIARFRQRHETALAGLFSEVLTLCAQEGLAKVGVVAIDGTKVHANASREATRDYEQIAKEILEQAAEVDRQEDEQFGDARGDELPAANLVDPALAVGLVGAVRGLLDREILCKAPLGLGKTLRSRLGNRAALPRRAWRPGVVWPRVASRGGLCSVESSAGWVRHRSRSSSPRRRRGRST